MSELLSYTKIYYPTNRMKELGYNSENPCVIGLIQDGAKRRLVLLSLSEIEIGMEINE